VPAPGALADEDELRPGGEREPGRAFVLVLGRERV
jgi:hypothetical protein